MSSFVAYDDSKSFRSKVIGFFVGFFIILYISILFGACYTPGATFNKWLDNFIYYVIEQHHFIIIAFTSATPKVILFLELIWVVVFLFIAIKIDHPFAGKEYGRARWGNAVRFSKKFADHKKKHEVEINFGDLPAPAAPVIVNTHNYWLAEGTYLSIDNKFTPNLNMIIIGPPGTGKSFRFVRPVLSQLSGSFIVTDPKGELSQQCGQFFEDNGYGVFVIDCESEAGMANSHHFNPFPYLETESDILSLSEIIFKATSGGDSSKDDPFFEGMARKLLTAIFYLIHYTYPKSQQDWKHFVELVNACIVRVNPQTGTIDNSDPNGIYQRFLRANEEWKEKHNGEEFKGFQDIDSIYSNAHETASSIVTSLSRHCEHMMIDSVINLLSHDDLDFLNTFGHAKKSKKSPTGKYVLFMITSEGERHFDWIPSMIYSLFFSKIYSLTKNDPTLNQTLPEHVTCLMDEFYNVTLPDSFVGLTSTMRSRGISVAIVVQNLLQLKDKFPENDMDKNLFSNMSTILILGGPDMDSCEALSKEFGKQTIHKKTTGLSRGAQGSSSENEDVMEHALFPADEINSMAKDGPCAIKVKGADPLWVNKVQFQNSPLCPLLTRKNPYKIKLKKVFYFKAYEYDKSPLDQLPVVYFGNDAEEVLKQAREESIRVAVYDETDIDAFSILSDKKIPLPGKDSTTKEFLRNVYKKTAYLLEEERKAAVSFDMYTSDQLMVAQMLRNAGFSIPQINALSGLINNNYSIDDLLKLFNKDMPVSDLKQFSDRLLSIKVSSFQ